MVEEKCSECRFENICKNATKKRYDEHGCNMFELK